jgi:prepilin-type N-terminal cleavage/methylation domain-containing protein
MRGRRERQGGGRGFTIIELLVAMAIVAVLAAMAIPMFLIGIKRARISEGIAHVREIQLAFDQYHIDNDRYPYVSELDRSTLVPLSPEYIRHVQGLMDGFEGREIHLYEGPTPSDSDSFRWYVFLRSRRQDDEAVRFRIEVDHGRIVLIYKGSELTEQEALRRANELL